MPSPRETAVPDDFTLLDAWWRAANYLSVGQIYLMDNPLLREPLALHQIKPRLLGHWGTTPGLNFVYAHMNRAIDASRPPSQATRILSKPEERRRPAHGTMSTGRPASSMTCSGSRRAASLTAAETSTWPTTIRSLARPWWTTALTGSPSTSLASHENVAGLVRLRNTWATVSARRRKYREASTIASSSRPPPRTAVPAAAVVHVGTMPMRWLPCSLAS